MNKTCDIDKLKQIFARGLVSGIGDTNQTCIEGAISLACGGDLSDSPACVANPDREFSIKINDASWSSNAARAEALLPLALAQIGTTGRDRSAWVKSVALGTIRRVLPMALRAVATISSDKHKKPLNDAADKCANAVDLSAASAASAAASDAARDARDAASAAASAAAWAATAAARDAARAAASAASAARAASAAARDAAWAARDAVLRESVAVALDAYAAEKV